MHQHFTSWPIRRLAVVLLLGAAGCSDGYPPTYPVAGKVVFTNGQPVRFGFVEFRSDDGGFSARGQIDFEGDFQLGTFQVADGAVAGEHRAIVTQYVPATTIEPTVKDYHDWQPDEEKDPHRVMGVVDTKFADYEQSEMEFTVMPGDKNQFELVVEGVPGSTRSTGDAHPHHSAHAD